MDESQVQKETKGKEEKKTTKEITKEDWEVCLKQFEAMRINALMNIECYENNIEYVKKKLGTFKEAEEEMPEDIKDIIQEATK